MPAHQSSQAKTMCAYAYRHRDVCAQPVDFYLCTDLYLARFTQYKHLHVPI